MKLRLGMGHGLSGLGSWGDCIVFLSNRTIQVSMVLEFGTFSKVAFCHTVCEVDVLIESVNWKEIRMAGMT